MIKITFSFLPSFEKNPKYTNYLEIGVYKNEKCLYLLTDDGQMIRYPLEDVIKIEKQIKDLTTKEIEWVNGKNNYRVEFNRAVGKLRVYKFTIHKVWEQLSSYDYIDIIALVKGE